MSVESDIATEPQWQRTRLRVPREDGAILARPAFDEILELASRNAAILSRSKCSLLDQPLAQLRNAARAELLSAATDFRATRSDSNDGILIATGHQPELVHPGVWIKQLAVGALARQHNVRGLNLVVDNDTLNSTSIRVPAGTRESLTTQTIEFDNPRPALPWEEAHVLNRNLFESFGDRVTALMQQWDIEPLLARIWPDVVKHSQSDSNLAACFTAARANVERNWGFGNFELRMSRLCESTSFRLFALHLLRHAERLRAIYNATVAEYRSINRIRNASHPVPDLQHIDQWCEVPLWIWPAGATSRSRVFVREQSEKLQIAAAPTDSQIVLELGARTSDFQDDLAKLGDLSLRGWRLRSRALTTTCFARLCLCDVFVHGIGGAKYDEITDRLLTRFFNVPAPGFVTLSATAYLPFTQPFAVTATDVLRLKHQLRDAQQNPQRHITVPHSSIESALIAEKQALVAKQQVSEVQHGRNARSSSGSPKKPCKEELHQSERAADSPKGAPHEEHAPRDDGSGYRRLRRIRQINQELAQSTAPQQDRLRSEIKAAEAAVAANSIIKSREFACWLYPEEAGLLALVPEVCMRPQGANEMLAVPNSDRVREA